MKWNGEIMEKNEILKLIKKWQNLSYFKNLSKEQLDLIYQVFDTREDWKKEALLLEIAHLLIKIHKIK